MSNVTTATVVVPVGQSIEQTEVDAIKQACRVFEQVEDHDFFYHDVQVDEEQDEKPVVPLDSEAGEERIVEKIEQTTESRVNNLKKILDVVEDEDTIDAAVQTQKLSSAAHRLGTYYHPEASYLFDGSSWMRGAPILSHEHLDEIIDHCDDDLFLVDVELQY